MNIELLTKLVKLANNNPNENEANLAARKVCKLIEEDKFQFNQSTAKSDYTNQQHQKTQTDNWWGFWGEPEFYYKSRPKSEPPPKPKEPVLTEKEIEMQEWNFSTTINLWINLRTAQTLTKEEYKQRFSRFGGKIVY